MKIKSICTNPLCLIASLLLLAGAGNRVQAATFTTTATATGSWSTPGNWAGGTAPTGNQAGNIAANGAANITLTLDVATTIGQIQDTRGSSQLFTINASGTTAMTFDNTGGVNNPLTRADAFIGETSSGPVTFLPNIVIQNTDLDFANTGSTSPTLTIGTLGTSTITATTPQNLFIFQNQATSTKSINVNSTIGSSGSVITVQNAGTGGGASTMNLNGVVGPNAAVVQNSTSSVLSLNVANTYTGSTTITLGTLKLGIANAIPSASSVSVTGTLNLNGKSDTIDALTGAGTVDATVAGTPTLTVGGNGGGGTFSGVIKNTAGTLALAKSGSGTEILSGANSYGGTTAINGGILNAGIAQNGSTSGPFGTSGTISFGGGTLQYSSANQNDYSGRFSTAASQPISIDANGQTTIIFATALTSSGGSLTLADSVGSGKLTLNATETYSGNTTVNGGTLALGASGILASASTINVGAGGTFDVTALGSSTTYTLGSGGLKASGTGTGSTTAATIVPGASGTFDTGAQPITFTWGGGSSGTDTTHPSLVVSQGTLNFSGNTVTVAVPGTALGIGTYTLVSGSAISGAPAVTPAFSGSGKVSGTSASLSVVGGNTLVLSVFAAGTSAVWTDGSSPDNNWSTPGNWLGGVAPSAAQDTATFGNTVSAVTLDTAETIGTLVFNQAASYTISGSSILTFDSLGGGGTITVSAGTANTIQPPVKLTDNTTVNYTAGMSLTLSGVVANTSGSRTLTLNGAGTTVLGNANTYGPSSGLGTTLGGGGTLQIGNNNALSTGDLSVSGSSTIQAGAASLSLANNISVPSSVTATVDNNGYALTLGGVISGSGALSAIGSGSLTLSGANTYSGGTTLAASSQLNINNGGSSSANSAIGTGTLTINGGTIDNTSSGDVTLLPTIAQNWNGDFTYVGSAHNLNLGSGAVTLGASRQVTVSANTLTVGGAISGTSFDLTKAGNGTLVLSGANTFGGTTLISAGALKLGNLSALQNSTLNYSSGTLDFGSMTAATLGGLSGTQASQNLGLANDSSVAVALTVGGNSASTSYSGNLSGPGSLTMAGTGTLTLGNANYTGSTAVTSSGTLTINGGSFGSSSSTINVALNNGGTATLNYSGNGTVTASTVGVGNVNAGASGSSMTITGGASANFSALNLGAAGNYFGNFTINTTGTVGLGAVTDYKDENANGPAGTAAGLVISAGTVTASSLIVQGAASTGAATVNMRGGSLTISGSSGAFEIGNGNSTRGGWLEMTGGTLTYLGTDGLLMGNVATTATGATISGGTANLTGITLNPIGGTASSLTVSNGATLYLGGVGLVLNQPSGTVFASLGNGGATVGALADWSSVAPITLAGSVGSTIFQAADASSTAHNISLGGILSGGGALTKTGNGTLKLGGNNSYGGTTTVSAGTLQVNGNDSSAAGAVTVQNSGTTLGGTGTIGGAATFQANTKLVPGDGVTASVPLSFASTLTLDAVATSVFAVNNAVGGAVNKVAVTGALTPAGSVIHIVNSGAALVPGTYPLFTYSGGVSGATFNATPVFDAGTAVHTASIVDNGSSQVSLLVPNAAPVVANIVTNDVATGLSWKIAISDLKTAAGWSDSDGDTVMLSSVAALSANGTSVTTDGTFVYYNGPVVAEDHFTYTVTDPYGATAVGTVYLEAVTGVIQNPSLDVNGHPTFGGSGVPNYIYGVESAPSLTGPWVNAGTVTTEGDGSWSFTDASQTNPTTEFYRLYAPYSADNPPQ